MRRKRIIIRRKRVRCEPKTTEFLSPSDAVSEQLRGIISFLDENMKGIDANISRDLKKTYQYIDGSIEKEQAELESADANDNVTPSNALPMPQLGLDDAILLDMPKSVKDSIQQVQRSIEETSASIYQTIEKTNLTVQAFEAAENNMVQELEHSPVATQANEFDEQHGPR